MPFASSELFKEKTYQELWGSTNCMLQNPSLMLLGNSHTLQKRYPPTQEQVGPRAYENLSSLTLPFCLTEESRCVWVPFPNSISLWRVDER